MCPLKSRSILNRNESSTLFPPTLSTLVPPRYIKNGGLTSKGSKAIEKTWEKKAKDAKKAKTSLTDDNPAEVRGGCYCGACRFKCVRLPEELQHCYCTLCRKMSGSAFQTWAPCEDSVIKWEGPEADPKNLSFLKLAKTSDFGKRHCCTVCGTTMTIVYNEEAGECTWLSAGSYLDESFFPEICEGIEGKRERGDKNAKFNWDKDYNPAKAAQYVEKKISRVAHICCGSVQPWYEIPKDIGKERIKGAG